MADLTDTDIQMLTFERDWWQNPGAKEQAIRDVFDINSTRYYQALNHLIDRPEALAHNPMLVRRLQRIRAQRRQLRAG